jgi:hypothetical protein
MDIDKVIKDLEEVIQFEHNPKDKNPSYKTTYNSKEDQLAELLGYLKVTFKYLIFSNEASERENKYLRHILENKED